MTQRELVLDIAMNLTRIGNWAADGYEARKKRIEQFLSETDQMVEQLKTMDFSTRFETTRKAFLKAFSRLKKSRKDIDWGEDMMTWGNILTHRASLL